MEGDVIIMSENDVINHSYGTEKEDDPDNVDGRTIRIAHIYVHARVLINRCFQICGINLFNVRTGNYILFIKLISLLSQIPVLFDGIHFHNLFNKFVENTNLFDDKKAEIEGFQIDAF